MEFKNIEAFLMVVEKGSFSAAAETLFITQPSISARIQILEQELDTPLFVRIIGRRVILTQAGEKVLPYFKQAYESTVTGLTALKEISNDKKTISIACPNHMGAEIMPELLKILYYYFPQYDYSIKVSVTSDILDDIRVGTVDLGLAYLKSLPDSTDLDAIHITNEQNILVIAPEHPLNQTTNASPSALHQERIFTYNKIFLTSQLVEKYLKKNGLKEPQMVEINNLGWIKMMVRKGLGVAFLQKMIVKEELENGMLVELPMSKTLPTVPIYLVLKTDLDKGIRKTIIDTIKQLFQKK